MADRPVSTLLAWLSQQPDFRTVYHPQPFQQLADTLRQAGYEEKAKAIMVAAKNHHRDLSETPSRVKLQLWFQWLIFTYGYGVSHPVIGLGILLLLGVWATGQRDGLLKRTSWGKRFWYSLDQAIPLLSLNERHKKVNLTGWVRGCFYAHQLIGFFFLSLLIAGLTGLTQGS